MTTSSHDESGRPAFVALQPTAPLAGFPAEAFKRRRDALRSACSGGIVVLRGATEGDVRPPATYTQDSSFFYLTGIETPGAYLVLLPDGVLASAGVRDLSPDVREILFLPVRNAAREVWTGAKLGPGIETAASVGIERVLAADGLWAALSGWLRRLPRAYVAAPFGDGAHDTQEYRLMEQIRAVAPVTQFADLGPALAALRVAKTPEEIARMREAVEITAAGQRAAREMIARGQGLWEYEIEAKVFETFRRHGAGLAFASIVAGGPRGTVLHYEDNRCQLAAGELVVVDIGARCGYYCGDLTRTYPVGGTFTPRQREIYALVLDAHRHAVESFAAGQDTLLSMRDRCKAYLRDSPIRARDANGTEHTMEAFMPHGLSHYVGLDVHDVGDVEQPLAPGSVVTVEPGIYVQGEGIGIRIEDDYVVTDTGLELLGPPLEKEIEAVEAAMRPR